MKRRLQILFLTFLLIAGLPLAGGLCSGLQLGFLLEMPPRTIVEQQPAFQPLLFGLLMLILTALILWVVWKLIQGRPATEMSPAGHPAQFPWWASVGVALNIISWIISWSDWGALLPLQAYIFFPLWLSFILIVNGLTVKRRGSSLLTRQPRAYLVLFGVSALFWWTFEYLNRFSKNWVYSMGEDLGGWEYFLRATLPFSTVLPAVWAVYELLGTWPGLRGRWGAIRFDSLCGRGTLWGFILVGAATLFALPFRPDLLFPVLWLSPMLILLGLCGLRARYAVRFMEERVWNFQIGQAALAGLICGFFWEFWNFHSEVQWIYQIPYVARWYVFEMPLPGYAGYLPFGVACLLVTFLCIPRTTEVR